MARFFVMATMSEKRNGDFLPSPITSILTGAGMKKYVAQNSLPVDAKLFELREVSYNINKITVPMEVDDITVGPEIP